MVFLLQFAYAANIIILAPVLLSMFCDDGDKPIRAFQSQVQNSDGLRLLIASLWSAIFLLSIAGLFNPKEFIPILVLQVIYKSVYLFSYVIPKFGRGGIRSIPLGLSLSFLIIVILWPLIIWLAIGTG